MGDPKVRDLYCAWEKAHAHLTSIATEQGRARNEILPAFGERVAAELMPGDIDDYRARRRLVVTRLGRPTTPATINREVALLHRMLNFGVARRLISANPIRGAVKLLREAPPPDVVVEEEGIERLMSLIGNRAARAWTILAFESGMRRGEIRQLCWRQLDPAACTITIPGAHTKSRRPRVVEFPARSQAAIAELPEVCDHVFANPSTRRPYHAQRLYKLFVRAVVLSGIVGADGKRPTWHALRRSYITLMRRRGVQETVVMKLSGHADRNVFERYNVVGGNEIAEAMKQNSEGRQRELAALVNHDRRGPQRAPERIFLRSRIVET